MSSSILGLVSSLKDNSQLAGYSESNIKQKIVRNMLHNLGWNLFEPSEVQEDYSSLGRRASFVLGINNRNVIVIGVKATESELRDIRSGLLRFAQEQNAGLAVLTTGRIWHFHLPDRGRSWADTKFLEVDIKKQAPNEVAERLETLLARRYVADESSERTAARLYDECISDAVIERHLPKAWDSLASFPPPELVRIVNDSLSRLCGFQAPEATIASFLKSLRPPNSPQSATSMAAATNAKATPGRQIEGFRFEGKWYRLSSQQEVLLTIARLIAGRQQKGFIEKCLQFRHRGRVLFAPSGSGLQRPTMVQPGLYVETQLSHKEIRDASYDLITCFGYASGALSFNKERPGI